MKPANQAVNYDFQTGKITGAGIIQRTGLELMRMAAWGARPLSFVGFSWAARILKTLFPANRPILATMHKDAVFEFPYGDGYWGRLLCNNELYSEDIDDFLKAIREIDYTFIDCGANYGYMSVIVSSNAYGNKRALAIEADPTTFNNLIANATHNNDRFEIRNNAIFSHSGEMVEIFGAKHEARSIVSDGSASSGSKIETLALDDLLPWINKDTAKPVLIKLDVEGVEIDAMKGATRLLENDCLIIFEDHGSDKSHEVSSYFLNDQEMRVFVSDKNACREIYDLSELDSLKRNSRVGYDFIATKSSFWLDIISEIRY